MGVQRKRDKKRGRKADIGLNGKRYVYYDDRSEVSADLEEAGFDDIEEEEFISGAIAEREDQEELEYQRQMKARKRRRRNEEENY